MSISAILLGVALMFTPITDLRITGLISIGDLIFVSAVLAGVVERFVHKEGFPILPAYLVAGILLCISFLVNLEVIERQVNQQLFIIVIINAILVPCGLMMVRLRSAAELQRLIYCWTAGGVFGAAFSVAFVHGFIPWHWDYGWSVLGRVQGLTPHPNIMALNSALAMPGLLLAMTVSRSIWVKVLCLPLLYILFVAVNEAGSRATMGVMLVMVIAYLGVQLWYADWDTRIRLLTIGLVAGLGLTLLWYFIDFGAPRRGSAFYRISNAQYLRSDTVRAVGNMHAWNGFLSAPIFGQGFFLMRFAHNIYLQALQSLGVVGAIGYLTTLFLPLWMLLRAPVTHAYRHLHFVLTATIVGLVAAAWYWSSFTDLNVSIAFAIALFAGYHFRVWAGQDVEQAKRELKSDADSSRDN